MPLDKLESHLLRSLPRELGGLDGSTTAGMVECHYPVKLRDNLFEDLKAFRGEICGRLVDARESSPGFAKLSTIPRTTGSVPAQKTMGISAVARLAAMVLLVEVV